MKSPRRTLLALLALLGAAFASARQLSVGDPLLSTEALLADPVAGFAVWAKVHGRRYPPEEHAARLKTFRSNVEAIAAHNAGTSSFTMAVNEFADLTFEEFSKMFGLDGTNAIRSGNSSATFSHASVRDVPSSVDWVKAGAVTPVKDQGSCGSCWAFSTTGAIEGINYIKTGKLVSLSEQQLVDCATEKNLGCGGGLMNWAFDYVQGNGGIDTEDNYGYWAFDLPCQTSKQSDRHVVAIDGHEEIPANDPVAFKKALSQQPVSVAICANSKLQFYASGVFDAESCCTQLNHGVLAVGYSDDAPTPYWLVKNSWGSAWGSDGYFKLASAVAAKEGTCGILEVASYPVKDTATNPEYNEFCGYFGFTECGPKYACECQFDLFGLVCLSWGCAAKDAPAAEVAEADSLQSI